MVSLKILPLAAFGVVAALMGSGCERRVGPTAAMEGQAPPAPAADSRVAKPEPDSTARPPAAGADLGASKDGMAAPARGGSLHASPGAEGVRRVQQELKAKGHDPGPIDGIMGPRTRAALRGFQQSQGLKADGVLDRQTAAALGMESAGASPGGTGPR